jgi:hypothetical protein
VEGDPQRLEERAVGYGESGRERNEAALRPGHPLPETTIVLPVSREADRFAEVRVSLQTQRAGLARNRRIDGHPPAVVGHSRELVAQHERPRDGGLADRSLAEPMKVRAAESNRPDAHEGFARLRLRPLLFVQPQVSFPVEPQGTH